MARRDSQQKKTTGYGNYEPQMWRAAASKANEISSFRVLKHLNYLQKLMVCE